MRAQAVVLSLVADRAVDHEERLTGRSRRAPAIVRPSHSRRNRPPSLSTPCGGSAPVLPRPNRTCEIARVGFVEEPERHAVDRDAILDRRDLRLDERLGNCALVGVGA